VCPCPDSRAPSNNRSGALELRTFAARIHGSGCVIWLCRMANDKIGFRKRLRSENGSRCDSTRINHEMRAYGADDDIFFHLFRRKFRKLRIQMIADSLAPIFWAISSPTEHEDHGIWPLKIGKLATLARVIGQLIIGEYCASHNVRSHAVQHPLKQCEVSAFFPVTRFRSRTCRPPEPKPMLPIFTRSCFFILREPVRSGCRMRWYFSRHNSLPSKSAEKKNASRRPTIPTFSLVWR
jgi:hypothetical protein